MNGISLRLSLDTATGEKWVRILEDDIEVLRVKVPLEGFAKARECGAVEILYNVP